ncbi:MAG: DMT family transporter [Ruminococcaceae bacterium]|nr:DMT family transporter [Oscillospiraceae bacterium]
MSMVQMILSMVIFGTVGIVVSYIPMDATMIVALRALIGVFVMAVAMVLRRKSINRSAILQNIWWLLLSGICLSANWVLLFMSYSYTGSVAVSTVCYYMAPVFMMLLSPLVLRERLSGLRVFCVMIAVGGVALLSFEDLTIGTGAQAFVGILMALGAAVLYAAVVLINKVMKRLPSQEATFVQLLVAAVVMLPFAFLVQREAIVLTVGSVVPMLILGVLHTGVAYMLFFGAAGKLSAQTTALLSYLDPFVAVVLSALLLHQQLGVLEIVGASMILGAAFIGEAFGGKKKRKR